MGTIHRAKGGQAVTEIPTPRAGETITVYVVVDGAQQPVSIWSAERFANKEVEVLNRDIGFAWRKGIATVKPMILDAPFLRLIE